MNIPAIVLPSIAIATLLVLPPITFRLSKPHIDPFTDRLFLLLLAGCLGFLIGLVVPLLHTVGAWFQLDSGYPKFLIGSGYMIYIYGWLMFFHGKRMWNKIREI